MTQAKEAAPDVLVAKAFTTFVFTPLTAEAKQWIEANVQSEPWQWLGASLVVETRLRLRLQYLSPRYRPRSHGSANSPRRCRLRPRTPSKATPARHVARITDS